ncbi:tol-pal system protein YbgF [Syntrophorhabdus aromaticivorans]|uniref:tol-pal system protein YbgF n=1 Tax=Syntrophorhabdus aromaticivorans TaxID=328301 RepID=UPI000406A3FA|nr:tol-pal system protein YbgF [Syntrophorhabdus aromaticivorans]
MKVHSIPSACYRNKAPRMLVAVMFLLGLLGCATTEDTMKLARNISATDTELIQYRKDTDQRLGALSKEDEAMRKQLVNLSSALDDQNDKIKMILGKLDELEHRQRESGKTGAVQGPPQSTPPVAVSKEYEAAYKDAFDAFQKKSYDESIQKFSAFIEANPGTPLVPNALYWIGQSYMNIKNYEKAILSFQELVDKYPKNPRVPRGLLAQAEAFNAINDKKSSITILKKVIELFPKSEEATMAERRLRN